ACTGSPPPPGTDPPRPPLGERCALTRSAARGAPAAAEHATRASPPPRASILLLREVLDERAQQGPEPEALRGQHLQALFLQGCRGDRADSCEQQTALPRLLAQSVEGVLLRGEVQPSRGAGRRGEDHGIDLSGSRGPDRSAHG